MCKRFPLSEIYILHDISHTCSVKKPGTTSRDPFFCGFIPIVPPV